MEYASIEREIHIDATPDVVFDVVSSPEHLKQWWPDDARYEPTPGSAGEISFGDKVVPFTVVDVQPPRLFSFRWANDPGQTAAQGNSFLVTFDLVPSDGGTLLRMTETGFRERGWTEAAAQQEYEDHIKGWGHFLPRLAPYVAKQTVRQ